MKVEIYIENQRIDLFESDSINVIQNVQDVNDISKISSDYSQSFSVPASDNNNRIFKHYYNADIDNGFDARLLKTAFILVDTIPFKYGKIRLEGAKVQDNKPKTYRLTFFGKSIDLKELIGDDELSDLDWLSNFDLDYDGATVKTGLTSGFDVTVGSESFQKAVVFPLISYTKQYKYNTDPTDTTNTDTLVNIAYDSGRTQGVDFKDLKPAIQINLITRAISEKYGFPFTSIFFLDDRFSKIYMNLNNSTDRIASGLLVVEEKTGSFAQDFDFITYRAFLTPKSGFENTQYKIRLTVNGQVRYETQNFITGTNFVQTPASAYNEEFEVKCEVITESDFEFDIDTTVRGFNVLGAVQNITVSFVNQVIDLRTRILNLLPKVKVFDFLTSIFKMFNLVAYSDDDTVRIEDLPNWYASGNIYDISKYVETKDLDVSRGKIYREINFKFEESDQILADEYLQSNGEGYGDLEYKLRNPDGTLVSNLVGDVLDIEVLFENPILERLTDENTGELSPIMYNPYFDREINSIAGKPFLFYVSRQNISNSPLGFNDETTYTQINTAYMPSHSQVIDSASFNLNFGSVINEYTYEIMEDTIYDRFYSDYIEDIFSIKRRLYKLKAILPTNLLNKLRLNDRLVIRNTRYIINKLASNIVNRMDDFELINDIYDAPLASDSLNNSLFRDSLVSYSASAQSGSNVYYGITGKSITLVDEGYGTSWVTLNTTVTSGSVTQVFFDLAQNSTGSDRYVSVRANDKLNDPEFIIEQRAETITSDNTIITVDNDIITVDNE